LPDGVVQVGHKLCGLQQQDDSVRLQFADEAGRSLQAEADVVIGADGIHSVVRSRVEPADNPRFSGLCAFRCLVPAEAAPEISRRPVQTLWLGPGRHFVQYPISAGRLVNVVAIVPAGDWRDESWTAPGSVADLAAAFDGWDPRVGQLIASARETRRWALFDREPLSRWTNGRVTLLGDAAHPMLPFFAQGSAQALEDAQALGQALHGVSRTDAPAALLAYEAARRSRATQVQLMSRNRELRNHLPDGPEQRQRDVELMAGQPLQQSAWLYGPVDGAR
jgi:salicylate hydroxylase